MVLDSGTYRGHLAELACNEQGHFQLDQAAETPVQPDLECFQGWGIYHLSGQPMPMFHHPHCKKFVPSIQSNTTGFYFKTIASFLLQHALLKSLSKIKCQCPKQKLLILLVTDSLLKQYLLPQLSCCSIFSTPKSVKVTLGLKPAGAINPKTTRLEHYNNLPPGISGHLTACISLKNLKRIH